LRPVCQGLPIGAAGAVVTQRIAGSINAESTPSVSPVMVAATVCGMIVIAAFACYLPARRAANADPNGLLKEL
jgi:ABC-type lipoprotein release transport system permease subunit